VSPPASSPSDKHVSHMFDVQIGKARTVAALMRVSLMSSGPVVLIFSSTNDAQAAAKDLTGFAAGKKAMVSSVPYAVKEIDQKDESAELADRFLHIDPKDIELKDADLTRMQSIADAARAISLQQSGRPVAGVQAVFSGVDEDPSTLTTFPILFSVGIEASSGASAVRLNVTVHSGRAIKQISGLKDALKSVTGQNINVEYRDLARQANDVPGGKFRQRAAEILRPGYSISLWDGPTSSVGLFVRKIGENGNNIYILGSGHGLASASDEANAEVWYPASEHTSKRVVGTISEVKFAKKHRSTQVVDAALAKLSNNAFAHATPADDETYNCSIIGNPSLNQSISVVGCSSGKKSGKVSRLGVDIDMIGKGGRIYRYINQIECINDYVQLGGPGDSGGIVVANDKNTIVGQINGWTPKKGDSNRYAGVYASSISNVLQALGVELIDMGSHP
jgi:hypothetical protein